ncbi:hypothetical protein ACLB2K_019763 [Fragaria x ananassa]
MGGGLPFEPRLAGYGGRRKEFRRKKDFGSRGSRRRFILHGGVREAATGLELQLGWRPTERDRNQGSKTRSTRPSTRRVLGTRLVTVAILAYSVPLVGQQKIGRVLGPTRSTRSNSGPTRSTRRSQSPSRSPSPRRLALPALFSRPIRLLSQGWIVDGGDDDVVSDLPSERVGEESRVDGGLEPRRGPRIQEIRELDENDFISDDEEEIDDLSFDFESDSEGVQDGYGEEEFEA